MSLAVFLTDFFKALSDKVQARDADLTITPGPHEYEIMVFKGENRVFVSLSVTDDGMRFELENYHKRKLVRNIHLAHTTTVDELCEATLNALV